MLGADQNGDMLTSRLLDYLDAHEHSYADDDWTRLEPFFTEGAVHEVSGGQPLGGRWVGRPALIGRLRERAETFDRLFDNRAISPRGVPIEMGQTVSLPWRGIYGINRAPADVLNIEGILVASFAGDAIEFLRDQLRPGTHRAIQRYLLRHGLDPRFEES